MEKKDEMVSIITLTYRIFDHLYETIDSVLKQNYSNIEYIVADDGSDNFPGNEILEYINRHKKHNIKNVVIIHNDKNRGTVYSYTNAAKKAAGTYIFPLSCGDLFVSCNTVEMITSVFIKTGCSSIGTRRLVCDDGLNPVYYMPHTMNIKYIYNMVKGNNMIDSFLINQFYDFASGSVLYFKKSLLEDMGYFDNRYILWEDGPMILKLLDSNQLVIDYSLVTIKYRLGGVSTSGKPNPLLGMDRKKFVSEDCLKMVNRLSKPKQEILLFIIKCAQYNISKSEKYIWCVKHPAASIIEINYRIRMKIARIIDHFLISNSKELRVDFDE